MQVTVIGSGYVGLVVGACLANVGNQVVCADIDPHKVEQLRQAIVPFYEPGLAALVQRNHDAGRLQFTTDVAGAIRKGALIFIAVGTPQGDDGSAELRFVREVARTIGESLDGGENALVSGYKIILTKSTVPVGTTELVAGLIAQHAQQPFAVCSNPEFLKEGDAVNDFLKPDRVIIGLPEGEGGRIAEEALREIYEPFCRTVDRIQFMDVRSSELTKYAANALLATKISFMNDLANLAERLGADIERVRVGIGSDPRIGYPFLYPGTGYGGSCFPKDVKALIHTAQGAEHPLRILEAVDAVNLAQKQILLRKVQRYFGGAEQLAGRTIAIWGLAFKPNTDDLREAPSLELIRGLLAAGAKVRAHDPQAMAGVRALFDEADVALFDDHYDCLEGADALCVCTEWSVYRRPNLQALSRLESRVIFDGRNLYDPERMAQRGFHYYAVGRGLSLPV